MTQPLIHGGDWAGFEAQYGRPPLDFSANVSPLGLPEAVRRAVEASLPHADRYLYFGRAAAHLDDAANWLPARLSGLLLILAAPLCGLSGKEAFRIWRRDRRNHASPNSAQTEAACAGALRVQLAGDAYYFGKLVHKPTLGDPLRPVEAEDIPRACRLMTTGSLLGLILLAGLLEVWLLCR